ncbi:MAG: CaiB/BaiF CoA-transferase family protein [Pseudomonadota bacterium]
MTETSPPQGPLAGVKIVEFEAIGPAPFAGMMLSDMGAEIIRIDRPASQEAAASARFNILNRGRRSIALNLKNDAHKQVALKLIANSDALIEGMRPGVMERLGLGPTEALDVNPRLVYGRMTAWGQDGPLAPRAAHDINVLALTGALGAIGDPSSPPPPPLTLVADFGGGGMLLAFALVCGVMEARSSGQGQVVDAAMFDGVNSLMAVVHGMMAAGSWSANRMDNIMDGGAPNYAAYAAADGGYVAYGALEEKFQTLAVNHMNALTGANMSGAPNKQALQAAFAAKRRDDWETHFDGTDACVSPVLTPAEAPQHPHAIARGAFFDAEGVTQPAPAPRFERTPGAVQGPPPAPGAHTEEILEELGLPPLS